MSALVCVLILFLFNSNLVLMQTNYEPMVLFEDDSGQLHEVTTFPTEEQITSKSSFLDDVPLDSTFKNKSASSITSYPRFEPKHLNQFRNETPKEGENVEDIRGIVDTQMDFDDTNRNSSFYNDVCQYCPEMRFLQHYFAKGCIALEFREECIPMFCPKYFICPEEKETVVLKNACRYNNTLYKFGQNVPHNDPCQHCICINSTSGPMLSCAISECLETVDVKPNCYSKYVDGKCCPETICKEDNSTFGTCLFEGNAYRFGEYFTPIDDPCYNCVCDERWNSTKDPLETQCRRIECTFDNDRPEHKGCAPVYSDKSCCPIYYHCPDEAVNKNEPKCIFGDKTYEIGEKIKVKQREVCLDCSCLVPPEISCKHRSCPIPPKNCSTIYIEGECCPHIDCRNKKTFMPTTANMEEMHENRYYEQDNWLRDCPPIDMCKYPCKLFLNDVDYRFDSAPKSKDDKFVSKCPECKCDLPEEQLVNKTCNGMCGANETLLKDSASERSSSFQLNENKSKRLGKLEKLLLERNGKRCPPVACEYPCYIYRIASGDCPQCSCSNKSKFFANKTVTVE